MSARRKHRRERKRVQPAAALPRAAPAWLGLRQADRVERLAYTRQQAAEALGVSVSTIDRRLVPIVATVLTPWGQRLIPIDELERFLRDHLVAGRARPAKRSAGRASGLPEHVVERIKLEYARGRTLGQIARMLDDEEVPTSRGGHRWWPSAVRAVLVRSSPPAAARRTDWPNGGSGDDPGLARPHTP